MDFASLPPVPTWPAPRRVPVEGRKAVVGGGHHRFQRLLKGELYVERSIVCTLKRSISSPRRGRGAVSRAWSARSTTLCCDR
jgi:hypothetical protein